MATQLTRGDPQQRRGWLSMPQASRLQIGPFAPNTLPPAEGGVPNKDVEQQYPSPHIRGAPGARLPRKSGQQGGGMGKLLRELRPRTHPKIPAGALVHPLWKRITTRMTTITLDQSSQKLKSVFKRWHQEVRRLLEPRAANKCKWR